MKTQIIMLSAAILAELSEKATAIEVQQNEGTYQPTIFSLNACLTNLILIKLPWLTR